MCIYLHRLNETYISASLGALGMAKNVKLDKEDEPILAPLLEKNNINLSEHGMITAYPKMHLQGKDILHSQDYTRSTRRNVFTVSFTDPERHYSVHFGRIRKFFSYPANSDDSIHVAVIQQVEIRLCSEIQSLHFPPEIQSLSPLLCSDYFSFSTGNYNGYGRGVEKFRSSYGPAKL